MESEDKPQQELSKLAEVAEAAPIKHEWHYTSNGSAAHQHPPVPEMLQVRVSEAGAEADPLQNGHPADLDTNAVPAESAYSTQQLQDHHGHVPQQSGQQMANGFSHSVPSRFAQEAPATAAAAVSGSGQGNLHSLAPVQTPQLPIADAHAFGNGTEQHSVAQVKTEEEQQPMGDELRSGAAELAEEEEEDVDIGSYVKPDLENGSQQHSGSSGSEDGHAVLMDIDSQGRHPSPAVHASSAQLGKL